MSQQKRGFAKGVTSDGYIYWTMGDLAVQLNQRPSDIREAIAELNIAPMHDAGDGLWSTPALWALRDYFNSNSETNK